MCNERENKESLQSEDVVHMIQDQAAKACEEKYHMQVWGKGSSMPGGIVKAIFLSFKYNGILTRDEIRKF